MTDQTSDRRRHRKPSGKPGRMPDLDDLELLVAVDRTGSIGRAAEQRRLSQPSVSRRMSALERALGIPLLSRTRRGSTLTPSGRVVVGWAESLLEEAERFGRAVVSLRDSGAVSVRVGVSITIAEHLAPAWIARLQQELPDLAVSLSVHNSTEVADAVEDGSVDLGFVESPSVRRTVHRRRIGWDELLVAAPPRHPWARIGDVAANQRAAARGLVREEGSGTRDTLEAALAREGLDLIPGPVLGSNATLKSAAVAGMGPVVLSRMALASELATGQLVQVAVPDLDLRRPLHAVWRRNERLPEGAVALLEVAVRHSP